MVIWNKKRESFGEGVREREKNKMREAGKKSKWPAHCRHRKTVLEVSHRQLPFLFFQRLLLTYGNMIPRRLPYVRTQGFMTYCR